MRYGTETKRSPEEVVDRARRFFGEGGQLGLPETERSPGIATFATEAGGVTVSAETMGGETAVTVLSREYDHWAEAFLRELG